MFFRPETDAEGTEVLESPRSFEKQMPSKDYEYTAEQLLALQNGEAIYEENDGDDLVSATEKPHFVAKQTSNAPASRSGQTATEEAAAGLLDEVEAGVEVDSVHGLESFVLKDPAKRKSNKEAHWMTEEEKWSEGYAWPIVIWMAVLHIGAVIALPFFTWQALLVAAVFHWASGSLGICLGYHRLLTHGGFKTYNWVKALFIFIGHTAGEGSADMWVATHRKHHAHSDKPGDPHSPHEGTWWSHMMWLYPFKSEKERTDLLMRWAPDMAKDPLVSWSAKYFLHTHFVVAVILGFLGYFLGAYVWPEIGGAWMSASFVAYGVFVRTVAVLHVTWLVNSASHMFGYRNYETTDDSRNNWLVAALAYGEGWHNNHHAYPRMAVHGHKWWEFDATWQFIRFLEFCGLAWDVVDYRTAKEKRERDAKAKS